MNTVLSLNSNVKAMNVEIFTKPKRNWASSLMLVAMFLSFSQVVLGQACPGKPVISAMEFSPSDPCLNLPHSISNLTISPLIQDLPPGYTYRYSIDGGPFVANSLPGGVPVGPHCFEVKIYATGPVACGTPLVNYVAGDSIPGTGQAYCIYFGTSGPTAIAPANILGNTLCVTTITPTPNPIRPCFTYEYELDNSGVWSSVVPIPVTPGCHTLRNRVVCGGSSGGSFGCFAGAPSPPSAATDFSIFHDLAAIPDANITINRTCSTGSNGAVTSITGLPTLPVGFVYEYFSNGAWSQVFPTNLAPGCNSISIRQVADCPGGSGDGTTPAMCRKTLNFVVYPPAPVLTATANTCASMFTLPSVPAIGGFSVQYSLDGGAWTANPSTTTPGCHTIAARYVTDGCVAPPFNQVPPGEFSDGTISACAAASNTVSIVIFPTAPVLTAPTNTCNSAFSIPTVATVSGFTAQWSVDGGTFTATPVAPVTPGCHNVRAQYVLTAACGLTAAGTAGTGLCGISNTVNVVIFPTAPVITKPADRCNAAFTLPAVTPVAGFNVEFRIDNNTAGTTGTWSTAPVIPTGPACYAVSARYVTAADCGVLPQNVIVAGTAGTGACGSSNTQNVVIFPGAPNIADPVDVCAAAFTLPTVPAIAGFTVYYSIDGGAFTVNPSTTTPGCHSVQARYGLTAACGTTPAGNFGPLLCGLSNIQFVAIFPASPVLTATANTCEGTPFALPTVPAVTNFTVQYRIDGGPWLITALANLARPTTAGCHTVEARYVLTVSCPLIPFSVLVPFNGGAAGPCGPSNVVSMVIFPTAPVLTWDPIVSPLGLVRCPGDQLPFYYGTDYAPDFAIQFNVNGVWIDPADYLGGDFDVPGCSAIRARWTLAADCGSTTAGSFGTGACGESNTINYVTMPEPPVITEPSNTCASMFTLPTVTAQPGFNVQYSIDNGATWSANPSTTAPGCYSVLARYVTAAACGTIPAGTPGINPALDPVLPQCATSNVVNVVIFPQITATTAAVTKSATCGTTDATFNWVAAPTSPLSGTAPAGGTFEVRYDIDGGTAFTNTDGIFPGVTPGCHTIEARYVLTTDCGGTIAPAVAPAACGVSRTFIVWANISASTVSVTLNNNCGAGVNVSAVTFSPALPSIPAGQEVVYSGSNNGVAFGPVNLAGLTAISFVPGCHNITARLRATVACGVATDGAAVNDLSPAACGTALRNFITFPAPPTLTVNTVCAGGSLVATPGSGAPAGYGWRYRLINNTTNVPVVGSWQVLPVFLVPNVGCYRIEATPVRTASCGAIFANIFNPIFPTNIQNPLDAQNGGNPPIVSAACTSFVDGFVLSAPPMAITPNNITVCLKETGKIDLQYFQQMVPTCLLAGGAQVRYIVTSSDSFVVVPVPAPGLAELPNNAPELMWMGENGNNFPNVVTIGITPLITLNGVTCTGTEVKFSITVNPNFPVLAPWAVTPNTPSQCATNDGWIVSTSANTKVGCQYELYFNPSSSPIGAPLGNALLQVITGNGAPVSFQKFYIPGTYQVWERCDGCAELAETFNLQIVGAPVLTDILLEECPNNPGSNTATFTNITYPTPAPTVPPSVVTILGYYKTYTGAANATAGDLISLTGGFSYTSSDATIYVRIGQNVDAVAGDDCFHVGAIELRVVNRPVVSLTALPNPACTQSTVTINANVTNGSSPTSAYTYSWERVSPATGAIAATTSTITVTEGVAGNQIYQVTVTDPNTGVNGQTGPSCTTVANITVNYIAPTVTCPANITAATDAGTCSAFLNLLPATINAPCSDIYTVRYYATGATTIGSAAAPVTLAEIVAVAFNKGATIVNAIVGSGAPFAPFAPAVTCSYTVTVQDLEPPIAKCKNFTVALNAAGTATITVADVNAGSSDNCPMVAVAATPLTFNCTNIGMNAVILTATDMSTNVNTCTAMVQVIDNIAPTLVCPASVAQNVAPGTGCTWVAAGLAPVTTSDNCTLPTSPLSYGILNPDQTIRSGTGNINGLVFDKGTSVVTYTLVDSVGNISQCSFTVTVNDNVNPAFANCPANVTVEITNSGFNIPGAPAGGYVITQPSNGDGCAVGIAYTAPTASDNCPMFDVKLTQGFGGAVHTYVAGSYTEEYVVTDMAGNRATCNFTITVTDRKSPVIACPASVTLGTDPAANCTAEITLTPTSSDNCNDVTISHFYTNGMPAPSALPNPAANSLANAALGLNSGTFFPGTNGVAGTTIVTYVATDVAGNTSACTVSVTVQDDDVPQIVCPNSVTINANGTCVGNLSNPYTASATDNCNAAGLVVSYVLSGATTGNGTGSVPVAQNYNLGTTFVTFTATDAAGNKATCTSTVSVVDRAAPTFVCPAATTVSANNNCVGFYTPVAPANQADNCALANPSWTASPVAGSALPLGANYFLYTVTDAAGNTTTCSQLVTVLDTTNPTISCPPSVVVGTDPSSLCSKYVALTPTVFDNCTNVTVTTAYANGTPVPSSLPGTNLGGLFQLGQTIVTFTVTDASNNAATCSMSVTVQDDDAPLITCPASVTVGTGVRTSCDAPLANPLNLVAASDNCTTLTTSLVQYALSGATAAGSTNTSGTAPNFGVPTSVIFNQGLTVVTYTATDAAGNKSTCSANVTVIDNTRPSNPVCQDSIVVTMAVGGASVTKGTATIVSTGSCGVTLSYAAPTSTDNCTPAAQLVQLVSGIGYTPNFYQYGGTYTATYKSVDVAGNVALAECSTVVRILDAIPPVITCPVNTTVGTDIGLCTAQVTYGQPLSSDNCNGYVTTLLSGPASGGVFSPGTTTVQYQVVDPAGNVKTCEFTVSVFDREAPKIACPSSIVVPTNVGFCYATLSAAQLTPVATDNCASNLVPANLSYTVSGVTTVSPANGQIVPIATQFQKGSTFVTYTVRDTSATRGNAASCTFEVIVEDKEVPRFTNCPNNQSVTIDINNTTIPTVSPDGGAGTVVGQLGLTATMSSNGNACGVQINYTAPAATDNCVMVSVVNNSGLGSGNHFFSTGTYLESYRVTDMGGNTADCQFTIIVNDLRAPVIACPANVTLGTDPANGCTADLSYAPVITDNCNFGNNNGSNPALQVSISGATTLPLTVAGNLLSTKFNLGVSIVNFTATDFRGNTSGCSFSVTVNDDDKPSITCPASVTVSAGATCTATPGTGFTASASDNCALAQVPMEWSLSGATIGVNSGGTPGGPTTVAFNLGTTVVTFTATDNAGNTRSCSAVVVVRDITVPTVTCPTNNNITVTLTGTPGNVVANITPAGSATLVSAGSCGVVLTYPAPTAADNCGVVTLPTVQLLSGVGYSNNFYQYSGVYTAVYQAQDAAGNVSTTCTVTVTVNDAVPPAITCPANTTVGTDQGLCTALVTYAQPLSADNCNGYVTTHVSGPLSGGLFNPGTTTVQYRVADPAGNVTTCDFTVTVFDREAPKLVCPQSSRIATTPALCSGTGTAAQVQPAILTDNCASGALLTSNLSWTVSGATTATGTGNIPTTQAFNKGLNYITYMVRDTSVTAGNMSNCQYIIEVFDNEDPTVVCPSNVVVDITDSNNSVTVTQGNIPVPGFVANLALSTGNFCGAQITYNTLAFADNCPMVVIANNGGKGAGSNFYAVGTSTESWRVTDMAGNTANCSFTITVNDRRKPTINCPGDVTLGTDPADQCTAFYTYTPTITDNCNFNNNPSGLNNAPLKVSISGATTLAQTVAGSSLSSLFNLGTSTVNFLVTDTWGNTNACAFNVTVKDDDKPLITCPANITLNANAVCVANATADQLLPTVSDNCILTTATLLNADHLKYSSTGANSLTGTSLVPSATNFNLGTTSLIYTVNDDNNNTRSCTFTVTVIDVTAPIISCPQSITVNTAGAWISPTTPVAAYSLTVIPSNNCGIQISYATPTATDNCSKAAVITTNLGGKGSGLNYYGVGVHTETWKAVDTAGNAATCVFTVTVQDKLNPTLFCPTSIVVGNDPGKCGANVNWQPPSLTDNCTSLTVTQTGGPAIGSFFASVVNAAGVPQVTSTITYTATDASNNTQTCSFTITVLDTEKPTIQCPIDMTVFAPSGTCGVNVMPNQMNGPFANDNCVFRLDWIATGVNPNAACPTGGTGGISAANNPTIAPNAAVLILNSIYRAPFPPLNYNGVPGGTLNGDQGNVGGLFFNVGLTTVNYVVRDVSNNTTTCSFKVLVRDTIKPTIRVNPLTITLEANGCYTLSAANITTLTNGTNDACGIKRITVIPNSFNCSNIGDNIVKIAVEDNNCNIDSACGIVKVLASPACATQIIVRSSTCMNNALDQKTGQFRDEIVITSVANRKWTVLTNNGFLVDNVSNDPNPGMYMNGQFFPAVYTNIPVGTELLSKTNLACGMAEYRLVGRHIDSLGYNITFRSDSLIIRGTIVGNGNNNLCFADTTRAQRTAGTANKAYYPNLAFRNWVDSWCIGSGLLTLNDKIDTLNTKVGTGTWTVNGLDLVANSQGLFQFNNALYGTGYHKLCYTFDAGTYVGTSESTSNTRDSVGCQTTICNTIQVGNSLAALICNDLLNISLDTLDNCTAFIDPDMILEGPQPCNADYEIIVKTQGGEILSSNYITSAMIGQTLIVQVINKTSKNSCWGKIKVEDKMAPIIYCQKDITVTCSTPLNDQSVSGTRVQNLPRVKECSRFDLTFEDEVFNDGCSSPFSFRIKRTWTAVDTFDQVSSCEQWIYFVRDTFAYNTLSNTNGFPTDANLDCSSNFTTVPSTDGFRHPSPTVSGSPKVKGRSIWPAGGTTCEINAQFTDVVVPICEPGEYKIIRTWTVLDWCRNNTVWTRQQVITIGNPNVPSFVPIADVTTGTGVNCNTSYKVPDLVINQSSCGDKVIISKVRVYRPKTNGDPNVPILPLNSKVGNIVTLNLGNNLIQYTLENTCTNATTVFNHIVNVRDTTKPVNVCRTLSEVSLSNGVDNPLTLVKECGLTRVDAISFDEGSWDNCNTPVYFKAKRVQNPGAYDNNANFDDYVYFNCEDVGKEISVILRVYDHEPQVGHVPNDNYVPFSELGSQYNDCEVRVNVRDLVNPTITCPSQVNISCTAYDFSIPLTNADTSWFNKYLGKVVTQDCNGINNSGTFTYFNGFGQVTANNGGAFDNCFVSIPQTISAQLECGVGTITRTFRAVDNGGRQSAPCTQLIVITNPTPFSINASHYTDPGSDLADPCDGAERIRINANEDFVNDLYVSPNFSPDNIIWPDKVVELTNCSGIDSIGTECANTGKDAGRPRILRNDKCDLVAITYKDEVFPIAAPACVKILRTWRVIDWCQNKPTGRIWTYVQIIKLVNKVAPEFTGNTCKNDTICQYPADCGPDPLTLCATATDDCTPADQLKYSFFIDVDNNGTNDASGTGSCVTLTKALGLKYGKHMITWSVEDNCGNVKTCSKLFIVRDCKRPTPVAKLLSIELMPIQCRATLEAVKVNNFSWDNCTPMANLRLRLAKSGQYSPTMTLDQVLALDAFVEFNGNEVGTQTIALFAIDEDNNWDYVETFVVVQSNMDPNCNTGGTTNVTGTIKTEQDVEVDNVDIYLNKVLYQNTAATNFFNMLLGKNQNYTVEPKRDIDPRNGVTTADLVAMNKHILAIQELNSPYKRIAADINNDKKISTADMVEMRKLILYINDKFNTNTSWKMIDKNYVFTTDRPEKEDYNMAVTFTNLTGNNVANFVATKIGDVNGTAKANGLAGDASDRSKGQLVFNTNDVELAKHETYKVDLSLNDVQDIEGYQFTLNFDQTAVEIVSIGGIAESNYGMSLLDRGVVTFSYDGDMNNGKLITITLRAKQSAQLSKVLSVSSAYTKAEAYTKFNGTYDVSLSFNGQVKNSFELFQNQPNPFNGKTVIGFKLPEATKATMTIYDVTGKVIKTISGDYAKGYNEILLDKETLNAVGVLSYRLTTEKYSETKQMIITE